MYSSKTKVGVRYAETDQMGVVYHSNFFLYYEVAGIESIRALGYIYADMEKMDVIMPVIEVQSRFIRPALYDDLLKVRTILNELRTHHKIEFHHEVYNEKNELLAKGGVMLYFKDAKTMKPCSMQSKPFEKIQPYFS
jgi:acyl-CoA thioester hydrolase